MRCLSCKYDLSKLTEHRCPECGRAFDPEDPRTFKPFVPFVLRFRLWLRVLGVVAILILSWKILDLLLAIINQ
jgi:predicted amidophosphoribosyltransferase